MNHFLTTTDVPIPLYSEAKEKKEAQDRYWKLHAAGKTEQAKTDLARLAAIRKQREEAAAQRKAETEGLSHVLFFNFCAIHALLHVTI